MSPMHLLLTTIPTIIFFDSLLWCHWSKVGEACYLSSLRSSDWVSKTQKNGVIGCQKHGQFLTVSLPVKTNVFPWLWSIHIRRGKIDGTTPLKMSPFSPVSWKYWLLNAKNSLFLLKLGWYLVTVVNFPFQSKMRAWRQFSADVSTFPSIFRTF